MAPTRKNDPEGLKKRIIDSALHVFAEYGLQGGRMEQIAAGAETTKRMVVYHFTNKETLYTQVLEQVYRQIRDHEQSLNLANLPPRTAIIRLAEASFDFHQAHPDFIRLICAENLQRGTTIRHAPQIHTDNRRALSLIQEILTRGYRSGDFSQSADAINLHRLISSICFHAVANSYTFNALFHDGDPGLQTAPRNRELVVTAALRYLGAASDATL